MAPSQYGKVVVCAETDALFNPCGKVCHPLGRPHLPGGLGRSHSEPNGVLACPGSWLQHDRTFMASRGRDFRAAQTADMSLRSTLATGTWAEATAHLRPRTSSLKTLTAGGLTHGAKDLRPQTTAVEEYDESKHGWYHPLGQAEQLRLADQKQPGSWAWMMGKSRDHNGYGDDGLVDRRDVQITAVSGDTPDWMIGTRTLPGPFSTRKFPVRRCPFVEIDGKTVRVQAKSYTVGAGLSTTEHLHDRAAPPTPVPIIRAPRHDDWEHPGKKCNLEVGGGIQTRALALPRSQHVSYDTCEPPRMRQMDRR